MKNFLIDAKKFAAENWFKLIFLALLVWFILIIQKSDFSINVYGDLDVDVGNQRESALQLRPPLTGEKDSFRIENY